MIYSQREKRRLKSLSDKQVPSCRLRSAAERADFISSDKTILSIIPLDL